MSVASEALAGSVFPRFRTRRRVLRMGVREYTIAESSELFVCVHLFGRWQWKRLKEISQKIFRTYRTKIAQTLGVLSSNIPKTEEECNINISGATGSNANQINGIFYPMRSSMGEDGHIVYIRDDDKTGNHHRWLYQDKKTSWRIGNTNNMRNRAAVGWLFNPTAAGDASGANIKPWQISSDKWKVWNGDDNGGRFEDCSSVTITKIDEINYGAQQLVTINNLKENLSILENKNKSIKTTNIRITKDNGCLLNGCKLLFNRLNKEEKHHLLQNGSTFSNIFNKKDLCAVCFSIDKKIEKCIHIDCPGACESCRTHENNDSDLCCACGKKQELQCPICFETKKKSNVEIFKCRHITCYQCLLQAYRVNPKKPLKICPTCRAKM